MLALLLASPAGDNVTPALAGIEGSVYTNDDAGYEVRWDDTVWFVVKDDAEPGSNDLVLSDGISYVFFSVERRLSRAAGCIELFARGLQNDPSVANLTALTDERGRPLRREGSNRAYVGFRYTLTLPDGFTTDFVAYVECRRLGALPGVLIILQLCPADLYEFEAPAVRELIRGVTILQKPRPDSPDTQDGNPNSTVKTLTGEKGPVFVSGPWRISLVLATRQAEEQTLGLSRRDGRAWVIIVADITNWSDGSSSFAPRAVTVQSPSGDRPYRIARGRTEAVAHQLSVEPKDADSDTLLAPYETRRFAFVYSVSEDADRLTLILDATLPLDDVLAPQPDLTHLPPVRRPPDLQAAVVGRIVDGDSIEVLTWDGSVRQTVNLIGVAAPRSGECLATAAVDRLRSLIGTTVWLEPGGADVSPTVVSRYVWIETGDGARVMLNRQLLAEGYVRYRDTNYTRFRLWLQDAEREARSTPAGIWASC